MSDASSEEPFSPPWASCSLTLSESSRACSSMLTRVLHIIAVEKVWSRTGTKVDKGEWAVKARRARAHLSCPPAGSFPRAQLHTLTNPSFPPSSQNNHGRCQPYVQHGHI
jgi:hypothetical protein